MKKEPAQDDWVVYDHRWVALVLVAVVALLAITFARNQVSETFSEIPTTATTAVEEGTGGLPASRP